MHALDDTGEPANSGRARLLIVEDDGIVAQDVKGSLEEMGYAVVDVVRRGEWALNAVQEEEPDLVLMDIRLAGSMDGVQASEAILEEEDVPVVYLTAYADDDTRSRVRATSPFGYVVKPFTDRDLQSAVEVALLRHRMERRLAAERSRLAKRVEEQSCLYDVSRILQDVSSGLDERLSRVVQRLPGGWQHSDVASVRLRLDDKTFRSGDVGPAASSLTAPIEVGGERTGEIEVRYLEERPDEDVGAFLAEEKRLLEEVAERVGSEVGRRRLEERMERLAAIVESTSDFVAMATADGETLWVNDPGREMLGIPREEDLEGDPISSYSPDWAARLIRDEGLPAARREGIWKGETALLTREGDEVPVSQVIVAHGSDGGEVAFYSTIARDISERKETERRLSRILDTAADGILLTDEEGHFEYANPAAEEILGLERSEIGERTYRDPDWEIRGPDGGPFPEDRLPVAQVLRNEEPVREVEHSVVRPDGSRIVLRVNANPLVDTEGELTGVVASTRDVTEQRRFEARLEQRALHDYLTGLPNRALFRDRLEHALERSERSGQHVAVLFVDLKRFKVVNDSLGHEAGDRVLKEVARRLRGGVRGQDTVARMGGDEFTVLLEEVDGEEGAFRVAKRLVGVFQEPVTVGEKEVPMEASIGIALLGDPEESDADGTDLLRRADAAMYRAKEMPGTRYALADPSTETSGPARLEREARLRRALADDRLTTAYQPIYSLETGEVRGVEALARWDEPELGEIPPATFIPLAEETGLIIDLGEGQLERASLQFPQGAHAAPGDDSLPRLHVNLSARQLEDPDVVERTKRILRETGFPASRLYLEITESVALREAETVARLKEEGIRLAIDDFGTQYSTLSQLRKLRTDALKIDRTFVAALPESERDRAIVETVLTLGGSLGVEVIAEGIETAEQLEVLRELGCDQAQGYHLARPMPLPDLRELLQGDGDD